MNPKHLLNSAITVRDLIDYLEGFRDDTKVMLRHPSHDYWRTELAAPVETVSEEHLFWSDYHDSFKLDDDNASSEYGRVVVLG